jgi:8-oxo-dGTP pyrophosphatase MutT (NUDIX family)
VRQIPRHPNDPRERTDVSSEHTPIRVIAAVISRGDELFVCQRPLHKRHGGLWEFPGGKCEPGESDTDAARRELREELGVDVVSVGEPELIVADHGSPFAIVFVPVCIDGVPTCHEHIALAWGEPAELRNLPLAPSDRVFVDHRCAATRD